LELTLESALSPEAMVGHLSYILLVVSMLSRRMVVLRIVVVASALAGMIYDIFILNDPVGAFWELLLAAVNVVQLARIWREDRVAEFSAEDRLLADDLPGLSPGRKRRLLDAGTWVDLPVGRVLTVAGERPEAVYFLTAGSAEVRRAGVAIARCGPGDFVGELALIEEGATASADVVVARTARAWRLPYARIGRLEQTQPEAFGALNTAIARGMRAKIVSAGDAPLTI
jgi:hypothetical protein